MRKIPITLTGLDARTDARRLQGIQTAYPEAEFGILISRTRTGQENRYPSLEVIERFLTGRLHLSLHVCGRLVDETLSEGFAVLDEFLHGRLRHFRRIQLNGLRKNGRILPATLPPVPEGIELILQESLPQDDATESRITDIIRPTPGTACSVLLDPSGGQGLDIPFHAASIPGCRTGYAGGITPANITDKLRSLLDQGASDFWLESETGVRTHDWLDLYKVEDLLDAVNGMLNPGQTVFRSKKWGPLDFVPHKESMHTCCRKCLLNRSHAECAMAPCAAIDRSDGRDGYFTFHQTPKR